jgi:hydrogenase maturation protease
MIGNLAISYEEVTRSVTCPTVVVGLGNDIAGDDAAGILTARRLRQRLEYALAPDVDVVELPWAGFNLLDVLRGRRRAILIDSLETQRHPAGAVVRLRDADLAGAIRLISYHDINYPTVLSLGKTLGYEMPDEIYILGIAGQRFDTFSCELTPAVEKGVERAVRLIYRLLKFLTR